LGYQVAEGDGVIVSYDYKHRVSDLLTAIHGLNSCLCPALQRKADVPAGVRELILAFERSAGHAPRVHESVPQPAKR